MDLNVKYFQFDGFNIFHEEINVLTLVMRWVYVIARVNNNGNFYYLLLVIAIVIERVSNSNMGHQNDSHKSFWMFLIYTYDIRADM